MNYPSTEETRKKPEASSLGFLYLDPLKLDAVREAANMGACHAAQAVCELLGQRVAVSPPEVKLLSREKMLRSLCISARRAALVVDTVLGDVTGQIAFVMPQDESADQESGFTEVERLEPGTFRQAADLVIGAYVDNLSKMMGLVLSLSPGTIKILNFRDLAPGLAACLDPDCRFAFCIDSKFIINGREHSLIGHFIFLPEEESLPTIIQSLFGNEGGETKISPAKPCPGNHKTGIETNILS